MRKIIVENSTWSNMGDGWYQFSLFHMIKSIFPADQILMGDGPMLRVFHKPHWTIANQFHLMDHQTADIHIFSGPILSRTFAPYYRDALQKIAERGEKYMIVSGSNSGEEVNSETIQCLKDFPPVLLATRDEATFQQVSPFVPNAYNGVCTAFFVNRIPVPEVRMAHPYFISSFYREIEPLFECPAGEEPTLDNVTIRKRTNLLPYRIARHLEFLYKHQTTLNDKFIIRPQQGFSTKFNHISFAAPNSFKSFNPLSYLSIFRSADFVITDRVHACAVGLSFNKPVRLCFDNPRAGIFARMGFDRYVHNGVMMPCAEKINAEYDQLASKIKEAVGRI